MFGPLSNRLACLALLASLLPAAPALAQRSRPPRPAQLKNEKSVVSAFRPVVAQPTKSTVRVMCDGKEVALGTVVGADGWIITKASELKGNVAVVLDSKRVPAVIFGVDEKTDLAMLKVEKAGLIPVEWAPSKSAEVGDWLAAVSTDEDPAAIGVVSVAARVPLPREMPAPAPKNDSGFMGVQLEDGDGAPVIASVEPSGAAAKAGLKKGDVVLTVQGKGVSDVPNLIATIQKFKAGAIVALKITRDGKEQELKVTLGKRPEGGAPSRGDFQNSMGSKLSERRGGFPAIMQSDLVIRPSDCGCPVVTLDGRAVGIMIARAGRTESYAIPSENVQGLLVSLKSGKLRPKEPAPALTLKDLEDAVNKADSTLRSKQDELRAADREETPDQKKIDALTAEAKKLKVQLEAAEKALAEAKRDATKEKGKK